jgi:chromosome segregation ATPase
MKTTSTRAQMFTLIVGLALSGQAYAGATAQEGLEKLKNNLVNSKTNLEEYQRNLKIVESNVGEVSKAKSQIDQQRSLMSKTMVENTNKLKTFERTEAELALLIQTEKKEIQAEEAKAKEMEKAMVQMRDNQAKRTANIANYEEQQKQIALDKADWKNRAELITKTMQELDARAKALATQENEWKGKLRGYQGEVSRWQKEVDRQQKLNDNYRSLADVKE